MLEVLCEDIRNQAVPSEGWCSGLELGLVLLVLYDLYHVHVSITSIELPAMSLLLCLAHIVSDVVFAEVLSQQHKQRLLMTVLS